MHDDDYDDDDDDDDNDISTHNSDGVGLQQLRRWEYREICNVGKHIDDSDERNRDPDSTRKITGHSGNNHINTHWRTTTSRTHSEEDYWTQR